MYFQETESKMIIKKIPKHAFARFGVAYPRLPNVGIFPGVFYVELVLKL